MRATFRRGRNIAKALRASLCCWRHFGYRLMESSHKRIRRNHNEEVNRCRNHKERNHGIQEISDHDVIDLNGTEVWFAHKIADNRSKYILHERGHNRSERAADDDANRKIEYVAAQNKITKSLQHCLPPESRCAHATGAAFWSGMRTFRSPTGRTAVRLPILHRLRAAGTTKDHLS